MEQTRKRIAAAILLVLVCIGAGLIWKYAGTPLVQFVSEPQLFRDWVEAYGIYSRIAFVGMVVLQVLVAVIPGEPFEIAAGYAFGIWEGTLLCILGAFIGSILTFGLVRRFGMGLVKLFFSEEQIASVRFLKSSPRRDLLFLVIYTLPGTPKDLLGYFAGLTDLPLGTFLLICSLGRFPSVITSTVGGSALGSKDYRFALITFAVTLVISAIGLTGYNHIRKHHQKGA